MKNKLFFVMLSVAFLVPQVIYAAWWNPLSWFNRWTFQPEKQESVNLNTEITHSEIQNQQTERKEDTTNTVESDSVKKI